MKKVVKQVDRTFGAIARALVSNLIARPFVWLNYKVTIEGGEEALSCEDGAIVVSNHLSMMDGPLLVAMAWKYARIRATAKYAQYMRPFFWPLMKLFGVICLGSPKDWTPQQRAAWKEQSIGIMNKVVAAGHFLLVFAEGVLGDGYSAKIDRRFVGVHDLIKKFPGKPVLLVNHQGLQFSIFGRRKAERGGSFFRRIPVNLTITRVDNVSLEGGPEALNERLEQFFNQKIPLAVKQSNVRRLFA